MAERISAVSEASIYPTFWSPIYGRVGSQWRNRRSRSSFSLLESTLNAKRSLIAVAVTGVVGAAVFGGTAVSTSFTDSHSGSVVANAAKFGGTYSTGDLRIDNAIPGDSNQITVSYTNNGTTPVDLVLTTDGLSQIGYDAANPGAGIALAKAVIINFEGQNTTMFDDQNFTFDLGKIAAGGVFSQVVTLTLPTTAGNEVEGGGASLHYTLTATAVH
jgi:hypothetical protein